MAKSATLSAASVPFYPGFKPADADESNGPTFGQHGLDVRSVSSLSAASFTEFRSAKSSPSPSQQSHGSRRENSPPFSKPDQSPTFHQVIANGPYINLDPKNAREGSILAVGGPSPSHDDLRNADNKPGALTARPSYASLQFDGRNQSPPIPPSLAHSGSTTWGNSSFKSTSPVSSLDSGSYMASSFDPQAFERQLRATPFISALVERLERCEASTRQIQTDLETMHRKVNFLVDSALAKPAPQVEFQDPFSPSVNVLQPSANGLGPRASIMHRPSVGNIAPNQLAPVEDVTHIATHLSALTNSVNQLLGMQSGLPPTASLGRKSTPGLNIPMDVAPHHIIPPVPNNSGMHFPNANRQDLRPPSRQPTMRTWSSGALDLSIRNSEPNLLRPDSMPKQRRSVAGLMRRDSSGLIEGSHGDGRDGPTISKWEQLSLAPEVLRSLNKFGIGPPNKIQQRALPFLLRGSDIIAQAPPTQERIAAYVIPAIQVAVTNLQASHRGPLVIMISTTVDQATQAQRMIRDIGGPIGIRSALGVGTTNATTDLSQELRLLQQNMPHIICGTPQKLHALFTAAGGLQGSDVRFLVLDEVDQLIARNLHEFVFNIVKLLPAPRSRPGNNANPGTPNTGSTLSPPTFTSPFDAHANGRRGSFAPSPVPPNEAPAQVAERQTALFSNTVPQDVLNLASAINLREPVRVLVRRDGNVSSNEPTQGSRGLRQFYLYLAFTAGARSESNNNNNGGGLGIIGSGRGATNAETAQAREWKLDALADLFEESETNQAIVHVGGMAALDAVVYKLASRGAEAIPLHGEMNAGTKLAALNKFRAPGPSIMTRSTTKILVVYDVQVKSPEVPHVPLVINYDLPKAVEEYAHRVVPAIAPNYSRAGVVINFVTATGGDVEMLRSIECFYKIKCPEVPMSLRDIL